MKIIYNFIENISFNLNFHDLYGIYKLLKFTDMYKIAYIAYNVNLVDVVYYPPCYVRIKTKEIGIDLEFGKLLTYRVVTNASNSNPLPSISVTIAYRNSSWHKKILLVYNMAVVHS